MLIPIDIPSEVDQRVIPQSWIDKLEGVRLRIQTFQDCWNRPQIEQFVAADFFHLFQAIAWIRETQSLIGNRFLEWGCGFAVVTSIASALEFESVGIEAEADLVREGQQTLQDWNVSAELIGGNFYPAVRSHWLTPQIFLVWDIASLVLTTIWDSNSMTFH